MSQNMMRSLLTPMGPGNVHCRNQDPTLPCGMPRIITANADDVQSWCGHRLRWSEPCQRKSIVFNVTKPLCDDEWRKGQVGEGANYENENQGAQVSRRMNENVNGLFLEEPLGPSLGARIAGMVRGIFGC